MTESDWLTCNDPQRMLQQLLEWKYGKMPFPHFRSPSNRKFRLWCLASRAASGRGLGDALYQTIDATDGADGGNAINNARSWANPEFDEIGDPPLAVRAALLRDIVGNPFRPVRLTPEEPPDTFAALDLLVRAAAKRAVGVVYVKRAHLTPTVLSLAQAAYEERPGRSCDNCLDGDIGCPKCEGAGYLYDPPYSLNRIKCDNCDEGLLPGKCNKCGGTGHLLDGSLDPLRLLVLADALEEAGCDGECVICKGTKRTFDMDKIHDIVSSPSGMDAVTIEAIKAGLIGTRVCPCNKDRLPHPLLQHLRSPGPHYRGCWALDLILGKE